MHVDLTQAKDPQARIQEFSSGGSNFSKIFDKQKKKRKKKEMK